MKLTSILLFCFLLVEMFGQVKISGVVRNRSNNEAVPFASIGISGKPVGTLSNMDGMFDLKLSEGQLNDSIRISAISYSSKIFLARDLRNKTNEIYLDPLPTSLQEVEIRSQKEKFHLFGKIHYHKSNCTGFASSDGNWKGSEAAILIKNKKKVVLNAFSFYVIRNTYKDSVMFRLMVYCVLPGKANDSVVPVGPTVLKKPIFFKVGLRQGVFRLQLRKEDIVVSGDFFISIECLSDEMDIARFCYSSTTRIPAYMKVKSYASWHKSPTNGGEFNVSVSHVTD